MSKIYSPDKSPNWFAHQSIDLIHQKGLAYLKQLANLYENPHLPYALKYLQYRSLLERIAKELTKLEVIQFSNLFSRISYINIQINFPKKEGYKLHEFRIQAEKMLSKNIKPEEHLHLNHLYSFALFIAKTHDISIPEDFIIQKPELEIIPELKIHSKKQIDLLKVQILEIKDNQMKCRVDSEEEMESIQVNFNVLNTNDAYKNVTNFWVGAQLYLLDITIDDSKIYYPRQIILEPDYLLDVSAIAECFQDYGTSPVQYLKRKFDTVANSKYIRLGNFANLVVDELITQKDIEKVNFKATFLKDFQNSPFEYSSCEDLNSNVDFMSYMTNAEMHFDNIHKVITKDLPQLNIDLEDITLEPSFMNEKYGIQGRLDILARNHKNELNIIELKSGGTVWPDDGLSIKPNHQTQLNLYYKLIGSIEGIEQQAIQEQIKGFILYSKVNSKNIRYKKPTLKSLQQIFNLRNQIILQEYELAKDDPKICREIIDKLNPLELLNAPNLNPNFKKILSKQILDLNQPFRKSSSLEMHYFYSFVSFIARENYLAKLGNSQFESNHGLANLWLSSFAEKKDRFDILYDLEIIENKSDDQEQQIVFKRSNIENKFANFRKGDIIVLYPRNKIEDYSTKHQIFKGSIKSIDKENVVVYFRHKQRGMRYFNQYKFWAIERDSMDNGFASMYKNIYNFIASNPKKKKLLLNQGIPQRDTAFEYHNEQLSIQQNTILKKALSAEDYFLLNGPPGTGKTSIIIKELTKHIVSKSEETLLLLAYTNRAVDEICESVNTAFEELNLDTSTNFIRIGGHLSCEETHLPKLLSKLSSTAKNRTELNTLINGQRVFISTVASISGKMDLLKLKKFDTIIIDEASQILEPQIIGILPQAKKFIMIGDHKQLPAIVLQEKEFSKVEIPSLVKIGLVNRKNSLFERLYLYVEKMNYNWAYDQLTYQGRMHQDIAYFPNHHFYDSKLQQAYDTDNLNETIKKMLHRQVVPLNFHLKYEDNLKSQLSQNRLLFFNTPSDSKSVNGKSNANEVAVIVQLIQNIYTIYQEHELNFDAKKTLGVITPYRNQIALIKQKLEEVNFPNHEEITIDTVERYQGSQREIILMSFTVSQTHQLSGLVNMNDQGDVDRKLNVALTRAREQLFLVGNEDILKENKIYKHLISHVKEVSILE